jgi:AmmeMemoRadiSam system protein A
MPLSEAKRNHPDAALLTRHGGTLLSVALASVEHGIGRNRPPPVDEGEYAADLLTARATFVTIRKSGALRGCVGTCLADQPLVKDVAVNAFAAAFHDIRFAPVARKELAALDISISLLSRPRPVAVKSEADLLARLRPGIDGLIIGEGRRRAVFLPEVWESLASPREFLAQLKLKAGLARDYWSAGMRVERFTARSISLSERPAAAG